MLEVREINNKKNWEDFLQSISDFYPLFQSWNWGEVQKKLGFSILRLGIFNKDDLVGVVQIVEIKAKRGHYLHLRHGPVFAEFCRENLDILLRYLKSQYKKDKISFIRISPLLPINEQNEKMLSSLGFRNAPIHNLDAEVCWILSLKKDEQELLSGMRKTHRYLIKKSQNIGLHIAKENRKEDIQDFIALYKSLSMRKHFVPHKGILEEYEIFNRDNQAELLLVKYEGKIIAGALFDFVGKMAIYRHSAFDENYKHLPVSYFLLWEAIRQAKKRNMAILNFWGIAPGDSKKHPWYGLSLFKTGFGGERKDFIHAKDLPLKLSYVKTYAVEMVAKMRKGY